MMLKLDKEKAGENLFIVKDMEKILSSLANEDALNIFKEAQKGITNSTETIKKIGLTQKRYYTRLKPLLEAGLIEKTEKGYGLTFLGKIMQEVLYRKLEKTLENKDRIALIDKLNKARSLTEEERKQITSVISTKDEIVGYSDFFGVIKPVNVILTWDEMVNTAKKLIIDAQEEIYLATRYTEMQIMEDVLKSIDRGVKFHALDSDKANLYERIQVLRLFLAHPKIIKLFYKALNSPNLEVKYANIPFSFFVIDKKKAGFEIVDHRTQEFLFAIILEDEIISERLIELFNQIFEVSQINSLKEILREEVEDKKGAS